MRESGEIGLIWGEKKLRNWAGNAAKLGQNGGIFCNGSGVGEIGRSGGTEGEQTVRGRDVNILKIKLR